MHDYLQMDVKDFANLLPQSASDSKIYTDLDAIGGTIFQKRKILKSKNERFQLPSSKSFYSSKPWTIPHLLLLKDELNRVKSLLDDFQSDKWHTHTRMMNPMSAVIKNIRMSYSHEFCSVAWCKLFEILNCHRVIPNILQDAAREVGSINIDSVHLCEAPGAFISATNHYLKTNFSDARWNWLATTLNPYYEGNDCCEALTQDDVILSTLFHWTFLGDHTGNIMDVANLQSLENQVNETLRNVQIVTADGSIDCADAPDEQEAVTSDLHYCEIMAALSVLSKGGTFVLKLFTFFEANTISKLYLLACFFTEVDVVKPAMSKEGNSEVYLVCRGYFGPLHMWKERTDLLNFIDSFPKDKVLFPLDSIPELFLNRIIEASLFYASEQISVIVRNVKAFPFAQDSPNFYKLMSPVKAQLATQWLKLTNMKQLSSEDFIVNLSQMRKRYAFKDTLRAGAISTESYNDRMSKGMDKKHPRYILILMEKLAALKKAHVDEDHILKFQLTLPYPHKLRLQWGQPVEYIRCSRFCNDDVLQLEKSLRKLIIDSDLTKPIQSSSNRYTTNCSHSALTELIPAGEVTSENQSTEFLCYGNERDPGNIYVTHNRGFTSFVSKLVSRLEIMEPGDNLFLCNFPLLTRVQCGVVILASAVFESCTLIQNYKESQIGIMFSGFMGTDDYKLWPEIKLVLTTKTGEAHVSSTERLMEVLPVTLLCQRRHFERFLIYNNTLLLKSIENELQFVQKVTEHAKSPTSKPS